MAALVSVIIPVHNLHAYIAACLKSLQAQTFTDWKAICVDDGSTDDTGAIIQSFAQDDARIVYIRQENAGVSVARNTGLAQAEGEFVTFLDGDDLLHPQFLALMLQAIDGYDLAASHYRRIYNHNVEYPTYTMPDRIPLDVDAFFHLKSGLTVGMLGKTVWAKLFRRSFAQAFSFPAGICLSEDIHYLGKLLTLHPRMCYVDLPLYDYFDRPASATRAAFSPKQFTATQTLDDLCAFLKDKDEPYLTGQSMLNLYANLFVVRTESVGTPYRKQAVHNCRTIGRKWMRTWLRNPTVSRKIRLLFLAFWISERSYELGRIHLDPTMKQQFRSRRKKARSG